MKQHILIILFSFFGLQMFSQECSPYFDFSIGQTFELTTYDKKDRANSYSKNEVLEVNSTIAGGLNAKFQSQISDKKGTEINTGEYSITCENGIYSVDIQNMINQDILKNYQGMEMKIEGHDFDLPNNLKAGQKLDDIEVKIHISSNGTKIMTMSLNFVDRKIEGFENVTTPAGEFECVVVTYTSQSKVAFVKTKMMSKDYFAKGVGLVKSEMFNKKGKPQGYTLLTKYNKFGK